jgi:hypothetical protein
VVIRSSVIAPGWTPVRIALFVGGLCCAGLAVGYIAAFTHGHDKLGVFVGALVALVAAVLAHRVWCRATGRDPDQRWRDRRPGPLG